MAPCLACWLIDVLCLEGVGIMHKTTLRSQTVVNFEHAVFVLSLACRLLTP